ncbi:MAG TPA: DMT family transporter [Steroidobacteraceae bacterium]|nr:DMT family transporter [Steroidobacteraceae bacterium]
MHRTSGRWRLGLALALVTAALWGLLPIALTLTLSGMDPYTITWYRFATSAFILGVIFAATRRLPPLSSLTRRNWLLLAMALLGLVLNYICYVLALHHVTPTVNQTVIQLAPMFLLIGGLFYFHERYARWQWFGFSVLVVGLLLFFNRRLPELADMSGGLGLGVALLVIASAVWAVYGLVQKQLLRQMSSQQILWVLYLGAVGLLLPFTRLGTIGELDALEFWMLVFCCANTLIGYGAFAEALEHWEVSRVGAVLALAPLFTLSGMWLLDSLAPGLVEPERLNGLSLFGALLVVAGSALCALGARQTEVLEEARAPEPPCV